MYSIEVDNTNPSALAYCLQRLERGIPDYYEWNIRINAGGIDYGVYLNIDIARKEIEISNQPNGRGEDCIDDLLEEFEEDEEDEDE